MQEQGPHVHTENAHLKWASVAPAKACCGTLLYSVGTLCCALSRSGCDTRPSSDV